MVENYQEKTVDCGTDALEIRHYYLWGSKKVPYASIKGVQRIALSALKGRARIWGTANMGYWANLDRRDRPRKRAWSSTSARASNRSSRPTTAIASKQYSANARDWDRPDQRSLARLFE
jgi:hypothetical protein